MAIATTPTSTVCTCMELTRALLTGSIGTHGQDIQLLPAKNTDEIHATKPEAKYDMKSSHQTENKRIEASIFYNTRDNRKVEHDGTKHDVNELTTNANMLTKP